MPWDLIFFRQAGGREPALEFLRGLSKAARAVEGGMNIKANARRGTRARDWLAEESKNPGFAEGLTKARARRRVARQIFDARKKAGVSQPELARRLGTSQAAVSRMEAGAQNMTIDLIENVAHALGGRFESQIILERRA